MVTRTISGLVFILIVIGTLWSGFFQTVFLFSIISYFGTLEYYKLTAKFAKPYRFYGALFSSSIVLVSGLITALPNAIWMLGSLISFMVLFVILLLKSRSKRAIVDISITIAGAMYLAMPFVSLLLLGVMDTFDLSDYNWHIPISIFILTWVNDTGAYLFGKNFGKHKLWERLSPKKTWEGSIGGLIFTIGGALILFHYWPSYSQPVWIGAAVLISIFSNLGDLMESAFKRNAEVKDSGNIMPGHGGILDRFDAVLLAAPVVFAYLLSLSAL